MRESEAERTTLGEPKRLANDELRQLAIQIVEGTVYCANSAEGIRWSFSLMLMLIDIPDDVAEKIGALYGPIDSAVPRSVNGYPILTSMRTLHVDDLEPLNDAVDEYKATREAFRSGGVA